MTKKITLPFAQLYEAELCLHLRARSRNQATFRAAGLLGKRAFYCGMNVIDLIKTHDRAMTEITDTTDFKELVNISNGFSPGREFLIESLASHDAENIQTHADVCEELRQSKESNAQELAQKSLQLAQSQFLLEQSHKRARQVLVTQEDERREISRELHDKVAQILAGINVRLATLQEVGYDSIESLEAGIEQMQQMIEESVEVVHRYARKLRPTILDDLGLIPALRSFIEELPKPPHLEIHFTASYEVQEIDNMKRTILFRIAQEALLNVIRHADAQNVIVSLETIPEGVRIEIQDDGKGFLLETIDSNDLNQFGLLGMKERVDIVGGVLTIKSSAISGTTVRADVPFKKGKELKR